MKVSNAPLKNKGNHNLGNSVVVVVVVVFECSYLFYYRAPDNFHGTFLTISLIRKKVV